MKHSIAFSQKTPGEDFAPLRSVDHADCSGELQFVRTGFWDDVNWTLYRCPACNDVVACVEGGVHWWNYTVTNPLILAEVKA